MASRSIEQIQADLDRVRARVLGPQAGEHERLHAAGAASLPRGRRMFAALAAALMVSGQGTAHLLPVGEFKARDGRPGDGRSWRINDGQGQALAERMNVVASRTPIVVDYDHATMTTRGTGITAPAAGWITALDWLPGKGLVAQVDWTARAKQLIAAREYLFMSPVIESDAAGEVTDVLMAALVNYPAMLGLDEVQLASSSMSHEGPQFP